MWRKLCKSFGMALCLGMKYGRLVNSISVTYNHDGRRERIYSFLLIMPLQIITIIYNLIEVPILCTE